MKKYEFVVNIVVNKGDYQREPVKLSKYLCTFYVNVYKHADVYVLMSVYMCIISTHIDVLRLHAYVSIKFERS